MINSQKSQQLLVRVPRTINTAAVTTAVLVEISQQKNVPWYKNKRGRYTPGKQTRPTSSSTCFGSMGNYCSSPEVQSETFTAVLSPFRYHRELRSPKGQPSTFTAVHRLEGCSEAMLGSEEGAWLHLGHRFPCYPKHVGDDVLLCRPRLIARGTRMIGTGACVPHVKPLFSTRRHPAQPVSVPTLQS